MKGAGDSGQNVAILAIKRLQKVAKVHCSQQPLRQGPPYLAQIFCNVCGFRLLFQICDILHHSKVIRLESAKVGEKSPQNLPIFTAVN